MQGWLHIPMEDIKTITLGFIGGVLLNINAEQVWSTFLLGCISGLSAWAIKRGLDWAFPKKKKNEQERI